MNRQRGFGVFDIVELIAIAALVGTLVAGAHHLWESFREWAAAPVVAQRQARFDADLKTETDTRKAAEDARDTARGNVTACEAAKKRQDDARAETDAQTARNFAAAEKSRAERAKREAAGAAHEAELRVIAAAKPKIEACEQERDLAKATLRDMLKARRAQ